jgi:hypothetical protein
MAIVTDNFNRADENPMSGSWSSLNDVAAESRLQIVSNHVENTGWGHAFSLYSSASFSNDQYSKVAVLLPYNNNGGGPCVRMSFADRTGYAMPAWNGNASITRMGGGGFVAWIVSEPYNAQAGDVMELRAVGNWLYGYVNGNLIVSASDVEYTTGSAGMFIYSAGMQFDNWEGGSMSDLIPSNRRVQFTGAKQIQSFRTL